MKYHFKTLQACCWFLSIPLLCSCVSLDQEQPQESEKQQRLQVELNQYQQSDFKQVEGMFFTHQSKELVFRVLSDIEKTSQWLQRLHSLEVLTVYNNHQYLLRTIINSPWPFQDRELITCVDTFFEETVTIIKISSCSERVPLNDQYVRLLNVESSWVISKISDSLVEVNYKTWIDPEGMVPAFIFNSELIDSTEIDLEKLQTIIDNASLSQYSY